jgi:DNA primase
MKWDDFVPWADFENPNEALKSVRLIDLLDRFQVEYFGIGGTQYKARCPFHADGQERTPSFCIYDDTNSYHCFGCAANGGIVEFVARQLGYATPTQGSLGYNLAVEELCKIAGITSGDSVVVAPVKKRLPEETVEFYVSALGIDIREFLKTKANKTSYTQWCAWAQEQFNKLDLMLDRIDDDNWAKAKQYCDSIRGKLT